MLNLNLGGPFECHLVDAWRAPGIPLHLCCCGGGGAKLTAQTGTELIAMIDLEAELVLILLLLRIVVAAVVAHHRRVTIWGIVGLLLLLKVIGCLLVGASAVVLLMKVCCGQRRKRGLLILVEMLLLDMLGLDEMMGGSVSLLEHLDVLLQLLAVDFKLVRVV